MTIHFFGQLKDATQQHSISINNIKDVNALQQQLTEMYPAISGQKYIVAVNKTIVKENMLLPEDAENALLQPFSGG